MKKEKLGLMVWLAIAGLLVGVVTIIATVRAGDKSRTPPRPEFDVAIDPLSGSTSQGNVIQAVVKVAGRHGYSRVVSLSSRVTPQGPVVSFTPSVANPSPEFTSSMTMRAPADASPGDYSIMVEAAGADEERKTCTYTLSILRTSTPVNTNKPEVEVDISDAFYPSGWMGDWEDIALDNACTETPHSKPVCTKLSYSAAGSQHQGWAGVYWLYPDKNWGDSPDARDLSGATKVVFWARGLRGKEKAEFKVGGVKGKYPESVQPAQSTGVVILGDAWERYEIPLAGRDLSHVVGGFCWVTSKSQNPGGCTVYVDDMHFE
jgi:hypothetical protein